MANHHDEHHGQGGAAHGSMREYVLGLILSIILTVIPFAAVGMDLFSNGITIAIILLCAVGQLFVQLVFFLHMNASSGQMWNTMSGIYVLLLIAFLIVGSIWIMNHLNHNMLLGH